MLENGNESNIKSKIGFEKTADSDTVLTYKVLTYKGPLVQLVTSKKPKALSKA